MSIFDDLPDAPAAPTIFDDLPSAGEQGPAPERTLGGTIKDIGITALRGAISVPEAAVGLMDIPTGGMAGKAAANAGVRFGEAKDILAQGYSPAQQTANQKVEQAEGFVDTVIAGVQNPSVPLHTTLESLPLIGAGGVVSRGLPIASGVARGAIGEGAVSAGSGAEQVRQQTPDGYLTADQGALMTASGAATGLLGLAGGKLAQKLGIADIDVIAAGGDVTGEKAKGLVRRFIDGAVSEGVAEELPQSVSEQVLQNLALGKDPMEGVDHAAAMGMLSGATMGGPIAAIKRPVTPQTQDHDVLNPEQSPVEEPVAASAAPEQAIPTAPMAEPAPAPVEEPIPLPAEEPVQGWQAQLGEQFGGVIPEDAPLPEEPLTREEFMAPPVSQEPEIQPVEEPLVSPEEDMEPLPQTGTNSTVTLASGIPVDQMVQELGKLKNNVKAALPKVQELAAHIYQGGAQTFDRFKAQMKKTLGDLYESFKGAMLQAFNYAKGKLKEERGSFSTEGGEFNPEEFGIVPESTEEIMDRADKELLAGFTPKESTRKALLKAYHSAEGEQKKQLLDLGVRYKQALEEEAKRPKQEKEIRKAQAEMEIEVEPLSKAPQEKVSNKATEDRGRGLNRLYDEQEAATPTPVKHLSAEEAGMEPTRKVKAPEVDPRWLEKESDAVRPRDLTDEQEADLHAARYKEQERSRRQEDESEFEQTEADEAPFLPNTDKEDKWFPKDQSNWDQTRRDERAQVSELDKVGGKSRINIDEEYARFREVRDKLRMQGAEQRKAEKGSVKKFDADKSLAEKGAFNKRFDQAQEDHLRRAAKDLEGNKDLRQVLGQELVALADTLYIPDVIAFIEKHDGPLSKLTEYPDSLSDLISYQETLKSAESEPVHYEKPYSPKAKDKAEVVRLLEEIADTIKGAQFLKNQGALKVLAKNPASVLRFLEKNTDAKGSAELIERFGIEFGKEDQRGKIQPLPITKELLFKLLKVANAADKVYLKEEGKDGVVKQESLHMREPARAEKPLPKGKITQKEEKGLTREEAVEVAYERFKATDTSQQEMISTLWLPFFKAVKNLAFAGRYNDLVDFDIEKLAKEVGRTIPSMIDPYQKLLKDDPQAAWDIVEQMLEEAFLLLPFEKNQTSDLYRGEVELPARIQPKEKHEPLTKKFDAFIDLTDSEGKLTTWERFDRVIKDLAKAQSSRRTTEKFIPPKTNKERERTVSGKTPLNLNKAMDRFFEESSYPRSIQRKIFDEMLHRSGLNALAGSQYSLAEKIDAVHSEGAMHASEERTVDGVVGNRSREYEAVKLTEDGQYQNYEHANDVRDMVEDIITSNLGPIVAEQRGFKSLEAYVKDLGARFALGWPKVKDNSESPQQKKRRSEARKSVYERDLMYLKAARLERQYRQTHLLDRKIFETLAEKYQGAGLSAAQIHDLYLHKGEVSRVMPILEAKVQEGIQEEADVLHDALRQEQEQKAKAELARKLATKDLSEVQKKLYGRYATASRTEQARIRRTATPEDWRMLTTTDRLEQDLTLSDKLDQVETATTKHLGGQPVAPEDIFQARKQPVKDPFVKDLLARNPNMTVGGLRGRTARFFYAAVAKAFGAKVVIVSDPSYRSRYIGAEGRIILNVQNPASLHKLFAHELFHHVVNRADPAAYQQFVKAIKATVGETLWTDQMKHPDPRVEEELMADLFAEVFTQQEFFDTLAETLPGRSLAQRLIQRILKLAGKVQGIFDTKSAWTYEGDVLLDPSSMDRIHLLLGDLIGSMGERHHSQEKLFTEMAAALEKPTGWLKGTWAKIFPKGTKSYREVMTNLEKVIKAVIAWAGEKKHGLLNAYEDFGADRRDKELAYLVLHNPSKERNRIKMEVVEKVGAAFDTFVQKRQKARLRWIEKQLTDGKITDKQAVELKKRASRQEILIDLHDDLIRGQMKETEAVEKYGQEIWDALQAFKVETDKIATELEKHDPDFRKRENHFGQFIKWQYKNGQPLDEDFVWENDHSKLEGSKKFKETKSKRTTRELMKEGFEFQTIEPTEMLLNYVSEANQLLSFQEMMAQGLASGRVKAFTSHGKANTEGFAPVNDKATKIMERLKVERGYRIELSDGSFYQEEGKAAVYLTQEEAQEAATHYTESFGEVTRVVGTDYATGKAFVIFAAGNGKKSQLSGTFTSRAEALEQIQTLKKAAPKGVSFTVEQAPAPPEAQIGQHYFTKDLARLLDVVMKPDPIRRHKVGRAALKIKNWSTNIEFALSLFHAMTIGQELVSSTASYKLKRQGIKGWASGFNVAKSLREAQEIATLFETLQRDPEMMEDPAVKKKVSELFGADGVDMVKLMGVYQGVGGMMEQDHSLRAGSYDWAKGKMKYADKSHSMKIEDGEVVFEGGGIRNLSGKVMLNSLKEVRDKALEAEPDKKLKAMLKTGLFAASDGASQWLMEYGIPRIKAAMWAREYVLSLEKHKAKLEAGLTDEQELARRSMKFIEDRFGEVNWDNMWMKPAYKTALQFVFRSYTWFTGSIGALSKGGIDIGKKGWYTVKGEQYELTEQGWWAINAVIAHIMTSALVTTAYMVANAGAGDDEAETPKDTPWLTQLLFPRFDRHDASSRVTIPSYVTELWKLGSHVGMGGNEVELTKIVSGRTNSVLSQGLEAWYHGEDWRGVRITDRDDSLPTAFAKKVWHTFAIAPISISTMASMYERKGFEPKGMTLALFGFTDAPAAAKRSAAANHAYALRRKEYKGSEKSQEEMDESMALKRAMVAYQKGDSTKINQMILKGEVSRRQFKRALTRVPTIGGKPNRAYKDPLSQALSGLTINGAIEVWGYMTDREKTAHRREILKKYRNTMDRGDRSRKEKLEIQSKMRDVGII